MHVTCINLTQQVNVDGFHNIIELCREHKLRLFSPSTIGAFGPESPKHMCPDLTIMRPKTVYGVSKVYMFFNQVLFKGNY